jgi:hypothetical protein
MLLGKLKEVARWIILAAIVLALLAYIFRAFRRVFL